MRVCKQTNKTTGLHASTKMNDLKHPSVCAGLQSEYSTFSMVTFRAEPVHNRWQQFALEAETPGSPVDVSVRAISGLASETRSSLG